MVAISTFAAQARKLLFTTGNTSDYNELKSSTLHIITFIKSWNLTQSQLLEGILENSGSLNHSSQRVSILLPFQIIPPSLIPLSLKKSLIPPSQYYSSKP